MEHPFLLGDFSDSSVYQDSLSQALRGYIIRQAQTQLKAEDLEYIVTGRRLLAVSREALRRVLLLATAWRLTGDDAFCACAERQLLSVAAFPDWNPSHFLDTAEMTTAVAIGYDWLYSCLSESTRQILTEAIIEKGLRPSLLPEYQRVFCIATNNWNSVCNGGMVLGALAIADIEPELAEQIIQRARDHIHLPMAEYEPDGIYPEGAAYWSYGTIYNILLIEAIRKAVEPGYEPPHLQTLLKSARYMRYCFASSSGKSYNYSDIAARRALHPELYWIARETQNDSLSAWQDTYLKTALEKEDLEERFDPLLMLWRIPPRAASEVSLPLTWSGQGPMPLAFLMSDDEPGALYVALKGGTADISHGHMDSGSFVLDRDGERWVIDPIVRKYHFFESSGVNELFVRRQDSQRWKIWENSPFSHATLTLDGQLHAMDSYAPILDFSPETKSATVDLSATLGLSARAALRHFQLLPDRRLRLRDELRGLPPGTKVHWSFATEAEISLTPSGAVLLQGKKTLPLMYSATPGSNLLIEKMDKGNMPWTPALPDIRLLVAEVIAPSNGNITIECTFG